MEKANQDRALREVDERVESVRNIENEPEGKQKVVAIEAAKYLSLGATGEVSGERSQIQDIRSFIQNLDTRIERLDSENALTRLKVQKYRRTYGDSHPAVLALAPDLEFNTAQLASLQEQRRLLQKKLEASNGKETDIASSSSVLSSFDTFLIQTYLATLQRESDRLRNSSASYAFDITQEEEAADMIRGDIEKLNVLARDIEQKGTAINEIVDQLSQLTVLAGNYTSTKVRVIDNPGIGYQVAPKLATTMLLFVFSGGMLGFGLIALLDWSDLSYRNPEEIKEKLGLPVVARIEKMSGGGKQKDGHSECLVTLERPKSAVSEAYRACRTALLFLAKQQNMKCFLITSPAAGDGKSTTAMNLAMCFAQGNLKTVIVDADLRRPRCHANLGVAASPGLKELSIGDATAEQIVRRCDLQPNLSIVTAGKHFSNPSEFLDSAQFEDFLQHLRSNFDIVIVDSPPVLPVADSMALSSLCDGVLMVLRIRKGVVLSSQKAVETLRSVNANLLGVVVNQVEKMSHYSDYGKYGYNGYGGYAYYAGRYYDKQNEKYYESESKPKKAESQS